MASRLARHGIRQVCASMLLAITKALRGKVESCHLKAGIPLAITSASLRNQPITSLLNIQPVKLHPSKNIDLYG